MFLAAFGLFLRAHVVIRAAFVAVQIAFAPDGVRFVMFLPELVRDGAAFVVIFPALAMDGAAFIAIFGAGGARRDFSAISRR